MLHIGDDRLVTCDGSDLKMWNIRDGTCVKDYNLHAQAIHVTKDRKLIAACNAVTKLKIFDLDSSNQVIDNFDTCANEITSLENGTIAIRHSDYRIYSVLFYSIDDKEC